MEQEEDRKKKLAAGKEKVFNMFLHVIYNKYFCVQENLCITLQSAMLQKLTDVYVSKHFKIRPFLRRFMPIL